MNPKRKQSPSNDDKHFTFNNLHDDVLRRISSFCTLRQLLVDLPAINKRTKFITNATNNNFVWSNTILVCIKTVNGNLSDTIENNKNSITPIHNQQNIPITYLSQIAFYHQLINKNGNELIINKNEFDKLFDKELQINNQLNDYKKAIKGIILFVIFIDKLIINKKFDEIFKILKDFVTLKNYLFIKETR